MNKAITLSAALAAAACAFLLVQTVEQRPPRGTPEPALPAAPTTPAVAAAAPSRVDTAPDSDAGALPARPGHRERNCELELRNFVTPSGEMFSAYRCTPQEPSEPHPYAHYDNVSLELIAYADPEAAALLGQRLVGSDPRKSYDMLLRATALSGDIGHLAWLADQAFSTVRIDGELQVANVKRRYELAALAARLGGDPTAARYFREALIGAGLGVDSMAPLDERVDQLLQSVREVQRSVYGEVRYGGQNDA